MIRARERATERDRARERERVKGGVVTLWEKSFLPREREKERLAERLD
jgi:hypothetical protein